MKRTLSCLTVAAALMLGAQAVHAANAVQEAQSLIEDGQLERALQRLDAQLDAAPQDAEARFLRGLVLTRLNRAEEAIKAFADITRDYPQLPEPYNNLAVLYAQQGDYEKARDALEAALATHPSYATAHENLGDIYAALAGAAYNRALMLDQGNQTVRNKLAFLNRISGDTVATAPSASSAPVTSPATTPATDSAPSVAAADPAPAAEAVPADAVGQADATAARQALLDWAQAWSRQDVAAYLAAYSEDFRPEGGIARSTWEAQRRERIERPARIQVTVVGPQFAALADGRVRITFRQEYESDSFSDQVTKVIEMRNVQGWKITREYTR